MPIPMLKPKFYAVLFIYVKLQYIVDTNKEHGKTGETFPEFVLNGGNPRKSSHRGIENISRKRVGDRRRMGREGGVGRGRGAWTNEL